MKKSHMLLIAIFTLAITGWIIFNNNSSSEQICIEKTCFNVEIADTDEKKILGLGNRDFLEENSGMLFSYPEKSTPGFWMKDMRFPIDIVWIDLEMKVSGIVKDFQPCEPDEFCPVVYPDEEIIYVLEINSGLSEAYGFEEGDEILLK